jgi:hypothetical protein
VFTTVQSETEPEAGESMKDFAIAATLLSIAWYVAADVSEVYVSPIFRRQAVQKFAS